jgi:hypothetical protein
MGTLIKGLGADHVNWGTDAVWTGSPQVADRGPAPARDPRGHAEEARLCAARPAGRPVKTAIFGGNNARLYNIQPKRAMLELKKDRITAWKQEYEKEGPTPTNMRYGYVAGTDRPLDVRLIQLKARTRRRTTPAGVVSTQCRDRACAPVRSISRRTPARPR